MHINGHSRLYTYTHEFQRELGSMGGVWGSRGKVKLCKQSTNI